MEKAKKIFDNKKVLIMGLGTKGGGVASAKFAYKYGASITITDLNSKKYLKNSLDELSTTPKVLVLDRHRFQDFENHDIIIKNPGIKYSNKYIQHALKHKKKIETPISLFTKLHKKPFIGITGTKGKSYTTALVSHLLSSLNVNNIAAGNNCVSPLDYVGKELEFVLELSSWQLHEMGTQNKSPNIACWLNFFPDHMNHYMSINKYFNDKSKIFKYQATNDYGIVPYEYTKIKDLMKQGRQLIYSGSDLSNYKLKTNESTCYIKNNIIIYKNEQQCLELANIELLWSNFAEHQLELVLASTCITIAYLKINNFHLNKESILKIQNGLSSFHGLEHRFETVYNNDKLRIINDSAASTPESAVLALQSVKTKPIILIAGGGGHKNLNYSTLIKEIKEQKTAVILYKNDETSGIIRKGLQSINYTDYYEISDLKEAIKYAFKLAKVGGTILLSPGCSGAPMFQDMFERGSLFKKYVKEQNFGN